MRIKNGMLSLDEIRFYLGTMLIYKTAAESGVSYPTLRRIRDTTDTNYRKHTIMKISKYLIPLTTTEEDDCE